MLRLLLMKIENTVVKMFGLQMSEMMRVEKMGVVRLNWQMGKALTCQVFMNMLICLRVFLNAHLHCCHKCPSAAQEPKTGFDYCRKINWQCSKYVIFSSERMNGRGWLDR